MPMKTRTERGVKVRNVGVQSTEEGGERGGPRGRHPPVFVLPKGGESRRYRVINRAEVERGDPGKWRNIGLGLRRTRG